MPVIGYNLNIPAANNNPSQDQPKMQTNTNAINTLLSLDHFTFSDNAAGRHKQVSLANAVGGIAPGIPANTNSVLYANLETGQSWPFWQNALGSFQIMQAPTANATNGSTLIPGGIILKWGTVNPIPAANGVVTYTVPFPSATFNVQLTLITAATAGTNHNSEISVNRLVAANFDNTGFTWNYNDNSSAYDKIFWFAIGN